MARESTPYQPVAGLYTSCSCAAACIVRRWETELDARYGVADIFQEIPFLSYPIEEVKTYSQLVRDRLGWKQSEPNLGWVDLKSPEYLLE